MEYDEEWVVKSGAWAGLGVLLMIGALLTVATILAYLFVKYLMGLG